MKLKNKTILLSLIISYLIACTPKGPQTFSSPFVGKSKTELIKALGQPNKVAFVSGNEILIYIIKEDYFGKKPPKPNIAPKKRFEIEKIYYLDKAFKVYKYQVWRKRID